MRRVGAGSGGGSRPARGVALIVVLAALALIAFVAARFAQRIDSLRQQTASLRDHAEQRLQAGNAMAAAIYSVVTLPVGPAGFGPDLVPLLRADNRPYALPAGGRVQLQDLRGLYPLNAPERASLARLLELAQVGPRAADQFYDVLQDYTDTDHLKRLNGAERQEYAALGLPPPRNDWLSSVRELNRMPAWKDAPAAVALMERLGSAARRPVLNPNTASIELLAAVLPGARPDQLDRLQALRANVPFLRGEDATRATGLMLARDEYVFHLGPELRISTWAQGSRRGLQYNVTLLPAGRDAPWLISETQPLLRAELRDTPDRADPFPLALPAVNKP